MRVGGVCVGVGGLGFGVLGHQQSDSGLGAQWCRSRPGGWIWVDAWRDRGLVGLHVGQSDAFGDLGSVAVLTLGRLVERIVEGVDPFVARASGQILARAVLISF